MCTSSGVGKDFLQKEDVVQLFARVMTTLQIFKIAYEGGRNSQLKMKLSHLMGNARGANLLPIENKKVQKAKKFSQQPREKLYNFSLGCDCMVSVNS